MILNGISKRNFLVIGRVGMDLSPDPPGTRTRNAQNMMVAMGGSSANIAAGLVKLGCQAALVTRVSDDAVGWYCEGQLDAYGVDRTHVSRIQGEERTSLAVYASFGALITAGTVFAAEPSRTATFRAFELAKAAGLPIIFDVDYRPYSWSSPRVAEEVLSRAGALSDVIVGNDEEFGFMAGDIAHGLDKARDLAGSSATIVVYKMGAEGAITLADGAEIRTGIFPTKAVKPTGAGDSFMAGFLAALADGQALRDAILRGSACASIVVAKPGCAPAMPNTAELEAYLASHPGPTDC